MFPVDNIRKACKAKNTNLAEVERALGIGNGVIAKWEKNKSYPPFDRIMAIADYLEVPVEALTGEPLKQKVPAAPMRDEELKFALFGDSDVMTDEDLQAVKKYAAFIKSQKEGEVEGPNVD